MVEDTDFFSRFPQLCMHSVTFVWPIIAVKDAAVIHRHGLFYKSGRLLFSPFLSAITINYGY